MSEKRAHAFLSAKSKKISSSEKKKIIKLHFFKTLFESANNVLWSMAVGVLCDPHFAEIFKLRNLLSTPLKRLRGQSLQSSDPFYSRMRCRDVIMYDVIGETKFQERILNVKDPPDRIYLDEESNFDQFHISCMTLSISSIRFDQIRSDSIRFDQI
jgi:hypothetical protein